MPRVAWDRLFAISPAATPFSRWTLHRAWWDAYGATAHEQYLAVVESDAVEVPVAELDPESIRGIVPLMHRHEVEPQDAVTATALRRSRGMATSIPPDAKAIFMGASYHADYATALCSAEDSRAVASALAHSLAAAQTDADHGNQPWDVVDLRRLRHDDPFRHALMPALEAMADEHGWAVLCEEEDVCPVASLADGDWEAYLAGLGKKSRHEIRRKLRRAEEAGPISFRLLEPTTASVDAFIDLHQSRWGDKGLFPDTEGGARSRRFLQRLAELESAEGETRQLQLGQVAVGDHIVFATVGFDDGVTTYFYNAGMAVDARELSPGVTGTAAYVRDRLDAGRRRFDFLRGNEPYKYEWGAQDELIYRVLVTRAATA